jgi:hypothetical protein
VVVRNTCSTGPNRAQGSMVKGIRTMFFLVEFADDLITVDERCGGGWKACAYVQVCHVLWH